MPHTVIDVDFSVECGGPDVLATLPHKEVPILLDGDVFVFEGSVTHATQRWGHHLIIKVGKGGGVFPELSFETKSLLRFKVGLHLCTSIFYWQSLNRYVYTLQFYLSC